MNVREINNVIIQKSHALGFTGEDTVVAVIDSGVSGDVIGNVDGAHDTAYHGTAVAKVIKDYIPDCKILSFSIFDSDMKGNTCKAISSLLSVIRYKLDNKNKFVIANLSWVIDDASYLTRRIVKSLISRLNKIGVPVVVAAGNDGTNVMSKYPACWPEPICVSACDEDGVRAAFSCWHNEVDFCDIGVNIHTVSSSGDPFVVNGTSFSTPVVTGKLAIIAEMFRDEYRRWPTEDELFEIASHCCIDLGKDGFDAYHGFGLLDPTKYEENSNLTEKPIKQSLFSRNKLQAQSSRGIVFNRNLKFGMRGSDVLSVKLKLVSLGYLHAATHNKFGSDTRRAVKTYQSVKGLEVDGIVGPITWASLFSPPDPTPTPDPTPAPSDSEIPSHIASPLRTALSYEFQELSQLRKDFVLLAIKYAVDTDDIPKYILGMYRRGGNAVNKDLSENIMTLSKLNSYFSNKGYAAYYDNGRKEMMLEASEVSGYKLLGCDCSGLVTFIRKLKNSKGKSVVSSGWDATANRIANTYCYQISDPKPGDLAWRSGHIGIVVSTRGGVIRVAESVGGAYGIQITYYNNRKVYNFVTKKWQKFSAWSGFYRLKCFGDE